MQAPSPDAAQPRLGLALGGGGARGLAHVGVLKALDRAGIAADVVAGTSMGGLIGGAYAAGLSGEAIEAEVLERARATRLIRLADRIPSLRALFSGRRFEAYLTEQFGAALRFDELRRPLAISTVDLNSGREVLFRDGLVVPALRATMSIPGVFAAVERDGRRLVDGGILNNVPADHARALGAEVVLAVDVLPHFPEGAPIPPEERPAVATPMELPLAPPGVRDVWEAAFVSVAALTEARLREARPELVLRPSFPAAITLLTGYTRAEESIAAGEAAMTAALPRLRALMAEGRPAPVTTA